MPQYFGKRCTYGFNHDTDRIGRGAFGSVFRANIEIPGEYTGALTVAVKVIYLTVSDRGTWSQHCDKNKENRIWTQEWRSLLKMKHANIATYHSVKIVEIYDNNHVMWNIQLMMDYYPEGDLAAFLHKLHETSGTLPLLRVTDFGSQIANGLHYLHSRKVIHTDLKPANVLLERTDGETYRLRIGDLEDRAIMKHSFTSNDITHLRGTARFMSPEMLDKFALEKDNIHPGRGTDIWSLGIIILELFSCHMGREETWFHLSKGKTEEKFQARGARDEVVIIKIASGFVPLIPKKLPSDLAKIVKKCVIVDPKQRISAAEASESLGEVHNKALRRNLSITSLLPETISGRFGLSLLCFDWDTNQFQSWKKEKLATKSRSFSMGILGPVQSYPYHY